MKPAASNLAPTPWLSAPTLHLLAGFCVAAWWLASPYLGLGHDALYYAADALRRGQFPGLNSDPFFGSGSQGNFTLYPLIYSGLLGWMDVHHAALLLTLSARLAWLGALALLCRTVCQGRPVWLLAFGLVLALPPGYDPQRIVAYGEPFATPRHWAELFVMLALTVHLRGRPWLAVLLAGAACALHPLLGAAGLSLTVLALPTRWRLTMLALGFTAACAMVLLGVGPLAHALDLYDEAWWAIVKTRNSLTLTTPWDADMLGRVVAWLALWAHASQRLSDAPAVRRLGYWGIASTVLLLALWVSGSWLHHVLLVQLQLSRGWWLAQVLTPIFVVAALTANTSGAWRPVDRIVTALILTALVSDLWTALPVALCALALTRITTVRTWLESRPAAQLRYATWLAGALLGLTMLSRLLRIGFNTLAYKLLWNDPHPALTATMSEPSVVILGSAALAALMVLVLRDKVSLRASTAVSAALAVAGLGFWLQQSLPRLDNAPDWEAAIRAEVPEGATVHWDDGLATTWLRLGRAAYGSSPQTAGALFGRASALELTRRMDWLDENHFDTGRNNTPEYKATMRSAGFDDIVRLCTDPALDLVMLSNERAGATKLFRWPGKPPISFFDCHTLRSQAAR